jgi:CheY-like chemotaxis protein
MSEPLALILYQKLLPGTQLVNRLQDLRYRVQTVASPEELVETAEASKPIVVVVDVDSKREETVQAVRKLRQNAATAHLPVIGFSARENADLRAMASGTEFTLVVTDTALLNHLEQCLERALHLD